MKLLKLNLLLILTLSISVSAVTIKIGSIAPQNSPWNDALMELSSEWSRISNGQVKLKIYPGGIAGDEHDMLTKMKANLLGGSALTSIGMNELYPGILASQLPMSYDSQEEFNYVFNRVKPTYEAELESQGAKVIIWTQVGWLHVFSKNVVTSPEHMRNEKLFVYSGDGQSVETWRSVGFNPVPLSLNDVMTSLQSGMVSSFINSPLSTAAMQWFGLSPNMTDMEWSPLMGGVIISKRIWDRIDPALQEELLVSAEEIGARMQIKIDEKNAEAIEIMQENGLVINHVTDEEIEEWRAVSEKVVADAIGTIIDEEGYLQVKGYIEEYRSQN